MVQKDAVYARNRAEFWSRNRSWVYYEECDILSGVHLLNSMQAVVTIKIAGAKNFSNISVVEMYRHFSNDSVPWAELSSSAKYSATSLIPSVIQGGRIKWTKLLVCDQDM